MQAFPRLRMQKEFLDVISKKQACTLKYAHALILLLLSTCSVGI